MDAREQRGLVIAATTKLIRKGKHWEVPSQSGNGGKYVVCADPKNPFCSCPDHEATGTFCKHYYAVRFVQQRELFPDGSERVTNTATIEEVIHRRTYSQKWPQYNEAQINEKEQFLKLLHNLCQTIEEPDTSNKRGPKPILLADGVFSACYKVFSGFSSRRFMSDLRDAHAKGYITKVHDFTSVLNKLKDPAYTPILKQLIVTSSLPLRSVETNFAVDSTAFAGSRFHKWFDHKHGKQRTCRVWTKAQIMCGTKTNIITSADICPDGGDAPFLPPLVRETAKNFAIGNVTADKGYSSLKNHEVIEDVGGTPFIAFKVDANGTRGGIWAKMFRYFTYEREKYLKHYNQRSNVESTMNMLKSKFRDHTMAKDKTAMGNEVLCKILCHNIVVLISAMYELKIQPVFDRIISDVNCAV